MTRPPVCPDRGLGALLAVAAAVILSLGIAAAPAGAHGGPGQLDVVSATRGAGDAVDLVVSLTYVNDGDPVTDATVTAVVGDAAAVPLTAGDEEGQYQGGVDAPPGSTIRLTAVEPVATLEIPAPGGGVTTTTEAPTTTPAPTTEAPTTTATPTTEATTTTGPVPGGTAVIVEDDDDGLPTGVLIGIGGAVAVVGAAAVFIAYTMGQRRKAEGDDDVTSGPDDPSAGGPAAGGPGTGTPPR